MFKKSNWLRQLGRWGARRLLRRSYRIFQRMPTQLQTLHKSKILVVAPHMDDEVIAPGGTLLLHRQIGSSMAVVFTSDSSGDASQTGIANESQIRREEAKAAGQFLGFTQIHFLNFPDGKLPRYEDRLAESLLPILFGWAPDTIFVPFPTDHHRDHQATTAAVALAIQQGKWKGEVWCYEVWSPLWPNTAIDISSVIEQKRQAISLHASQMKNMNYIEAALGLNRYRGLKVGVDYAEAFFVCSASQFVYYCDELLHRI